MHPVSALVPGIGSTPAAVRAGPVSEARRFESEAGYCDPLARFLNSS